MLRRWLVPCLFLIAGVARAQPATIEKDIVFGRGGDVELKLDLCRPAAGKGPFPVVMCVHGGAWQIGDRTMQHPNIRLLAKEGYVAVTIQYRLAPKHPWPAQIEDVKCAVRFLRSKAKDWNLDPERIAALGESAGGHLSLLVGLLNGKGDHADQSSKVRAVVNYYGPTDFATWRPTALGDMMLKLRLQRDGDGILTDLLGTSNRSAPVIKTSSPLTHVSPDGPPILTFQGTADPLVPDPQARVLHEALKKAGTPNRLELLENASHGWSGELRERTNRITFEFLGEHLRK
jgi:acetyl esterase/lipase